jgi:hypothetical protein
MNDKEVVRMIEPHACIEHTEEGWLVRKHPEGCPLGGGHTLSHAWRAARMNLFRASISGILSEIPAVEK